MRESNSGPTGNQHTIDMFYQTPIDQRGFDEGQCNTNCDSIALIPNGASNLAPQINT